MWSLFKLKASCPVGLEERAWIEGRFSWLTSQFGPRVPKDAIVVLPTPEFFPDPYHGRPEDVPPLFGRVCGYLGLDPDRFDLKLYSEADRAPFLVDERRYVEGTAGLYQGGECPVVWVEYSRLADPPALVATLIHEACHDLLLGEGRLRGDEPDHELVTDLLTVYLGLGVITANSTIRESSWRGGGWEGWRIGRQGYLTQPMYGYALARFASARGETKPGWLKHLRPDVRVPCQQGIRYLAETGDPQAAEVRPV
jgi:hypothetical protein